MKSMQDDCNKLAPWPVKVLNVRFPRISLQQYARPGARPVALPAGLVVTTCRGRRYSRLWYVVRRRTCFLEQRECCALDKGFVDFRLISRARLTAQDLSAGISPG